MGPDTREVMPALSAAHEEDGMDRGGTDVDFDSDSDPDTSKAGKVRPFCLFSKKGWTDPIPSG